MSDAHAEIDRAIAEIDHVRKVLARLKARRIRNSEHRDLLKASALTWFRSHRGPVVGAIRADLLDGIDRPYQRVLDAAERDSAKNTYLVAVRDAKNALAAARAELLVAAPAPHTPDVAPDFSPLAADSLMQAILTRRWNECQRCLEASAPLAATVMMGGLLEALFVSRANKLSDKTRLFSSLAAPFDKKTGKALDLRHWTLAAYIDVGHDLEWISRSAKDVAVVLRDYRNYIHPEKERAHGVALSVDDATMLWGVTKTLAKELLAMKGAA